MDKLEKVHEKAVELTKEKLMEDITEYLADKQEPPTVREYISDRRHYIENLWLNVWLNQVRNFVSRADKKEFLDLAGYDVDDMKRKLMNQLFEGEIREYAPFNTIKWVEDEYSPNQQKWLDHYKMAREIFLEREMVRVLHDKKKMLLRRLSDAFLQVMDYNKLLIYVTIRYKIALRMKQLFHSNKKYELTKNETINAVGQLNINDYFIMKEFLQEFTGETTVVDHKKRYVVYETYEDIISPLFRQLVKKTALRVTSEQLSTELIEQYEALFQQKLTNILLADIVYEELQQVYHEYYFMLMEEAVTDLLSLADIPFNEEEHLEIYTQDIMEMDKRQQEYERITLKEQEREKRVLEDIFGREYYPAPGRNIKYVLHIGDTNTGKTFHALQRMKEASSGIYLAPLRLLALEVYDKLNLEGVPCSLKTGEEEKETRDASHLSCTVEMFTEKEFFDVVVIDEAQMIADKDRGFSWYKAITRAHANEVHIIGSVNSKPMVLQLLGDSQIEIKEYEREVPLQVEKKEFNLRQTKKGDALVCFSRKRVLETASVLENTGHRVSMIYGSMPPETRKKQIQRFISGEAKVIVATDAIGMGLNLPIRRIVFLENQKFDGTRRRYLTSQEVKQIAGRAGRKGIYDIGKVAFTKDIKRMKALLHQEDIPVQTFAIAPTNAIFERFQKYYRDLGTFFELWDQFESPKGTKKASLQEERELYEMIRGTEIDVRFSMMDLYGFLHLPFSKKETQLLNQWYDTMLALVRGLELPEPRITRRSLEDLELSYKAVGLHLLFLYRLGRKTEALYWERLREELSDDVHESLKNDVKKYSKKCKRCGDILPIGFQYTICNRCFAAKYKQREYTAYRKY